MMEILFDHPDRGADYLFVAIILIVIFWWAAETAKINT